MTIKPKPLVEAPSSLAGEWGRTCDFVAASEDFADSNRKELQRRRLRDLLMVGAASPWAGEADSTYFVNLRAKVPGLR